MPVTRDVLQAIHQRNTGPNPGSDLFATFNPFAQTPAETSTGIIPADFSYSAAPIDVLREGIYPNDASKAALNTSRLKTLLDPTKQGPIGRLQFTPIIGVDVYYFTGVVPCRDGMTWQLMGTTLNLTGTGTSNDTNSGFIFALHDLVVENGNIVVNWATGASTSSGSAICVGARPTGSSYFQVTDSTLPVPLGNVTLRNLRLNITVTGAGLSSCSGVQLTGGIQGFLMENVYINGNGTLPQMVTYEFGFATTTQPQQSSHLNEAKFVNIRLQNGDASAGFGITLTGAYNISVDGFFCTDIANPILINAGEAQNFNGWAGKDPVGLKHNISLRNIVARAFSNVGITIEGAQKITPNTGYLSYINSPASGSTVTAGHVIINDPNMYTVAVGGTNSSSGTGPSGTGAGIVDGTATYNWLASGYPFTGGAANSAWPNSTDLYDVIMENLVLDGSANSGSWGIKTSAGRTHINGAVLTACGRGIVATDEAVIQDYNALIILNSQQQGMQLDFGSAVWSPARQKKISIRNSYIAGSSRSSAGAFYAVHIGANTDSVVLENNRFGYETAHAGFNDATQGGGVFLSGAANNVICRGNRCAPPVGGSTSYFTGQASSNGSTIINATGDISTSGPWLTDFQSASAQSITGNGQTINTQGLKVARVTAGGAFTALILQSGTDPRQEIVVVHEGGAANTLTMAVAATSRVADGVGTVIAGLTASRFVWDTTTSLWYHIK